MYSNETDREALIRKLKWKKFPALSDGHVCLVDVMGDDSDICQAARVSYGAGTKSVSDDETLIRYLMRHRHTTPLEMVEVKLRIRIPMDAWRQFIRHRTANVNEYSTRYSKAIDSCDVTDPAEWRLQATNNKQGSSGLLEEWPEGWHVDGEGTVHGPDNYMLSTVEDVSTPGKFLSYWEAKNQGFMHQDYDIRLALGVAREVARKDLPLSTYTEAYWKCDLHNIIHFLSLRMDSHAQKEIRDYANIIGLEIIKPLFPAVWRAFEDYRLNAMQLTALDIKAINIHQSGDRWEEVAAVFANKREYSEFCDKAVTLGLMGSAPPK